MSSPLRHLCVDADGVVSDRLLASYFTLDSIEDGQTVEYQLPYGAWVRLFRQHGLSVDDLLELRPPAGATTTYAGYAPLEWARRWPAEQIWRVRKT
jgi:hypothetical protein